MAQNWNAWGRAWGDSWGLSWGLTYEANQDDLQQYVGGGRKVWHELTVEEVEQQWDLLDLRTKANTLEIPEGSPPVEVSDQNPVNNAGREAAMVSGPVNVAMPANYQGILTSSPTDSAGEPLAPDQAAAAIEARRQRNNKALAMMLMEL